MKKNVIYEIYKKYESDVMVYCHFWHTTKGYVKCLRKVSGGKEIEITNSKVGSDCYNYGEEISKDEYESVKIG